MSDFMGGMFDFNEDGHTVRRHIDGAVKAKLFSVLTSAA